MTCCDRVAVLPMIASREHCTASDFPLIIGSALYLILGRRGGLQAAHSRVPAGPVAPYFVVDVGPYRPAVSGAGGAGRHPGRIPNVSTPCRMATARGGPGIISLTQQKKEELYAVATFPLESGLLYWFMAASLENSLQGASG